MDRNIVCKYRKKDCVLVWIEILFVSIDRNTSNGYRQKLFVNIQKILFRNIDRNIYKYRQKYRNITQSIDIDKIYKADKTIINENRQKYNS